MKKLISFLFIAITCVLFSSNANCQNRIQIKEGLFLVSYGNHAIIEDEIKQQSISVEISQAGIDKATNRKLYNVACGKWSKRVIEGGLNAAIAAGIAASGASGGTSLMVSAASKLASFIYSDACEYYKNSY